MGSSLSATALSAPQSAPPTSTTTSSLSSSGSLSSSSSNGSVAAAKATNSAYRLGELGVAGRYGRFYGTAAGNSCHLPRLMSGKSIAASSAFSRDFECDCRQCDCNCDCVDEGVYYGCCECESAGAALNRPHNCCAQSYSRKEEEELCDNSFTSAFALFVKRSQRNNNDGYLYNQSAAVCKNRTKIRRPRGDTHCVSNIVAHGRNALAYSGSYGHDSGFNSGATSARSANSARCDKDSSALLWNISQRLGVNDETTLHDIRAIMRQRAAANDVQGSSGNKHNTIKSNAVSVEKEDESTAVLTAALTSLRVENNAKTAPSQRAEISVPLYSSTIDEKTLETYKYDRCLTPGTNDIDAARYSAADMGRTKTLKKGAQSGFFATQYAKLTEKRISIGRWANFTSNGQKASVCVPQSAAAICQTKNCSKTTTSLLGDADRRQQQEAAQSTTKPTTERPMTATGDRSVRNQRSSLMSVLPISFSAYRLAGLLNGGKERIAEREKTLIANEEDTQAPSSQDGKRPLSWTGSLADSVLSGSGAALSRPSSSYSTAGWDSGFYGETNSNACIGNGMVHYDGRLKRSTLTTATSGYGSFSERLVSPESEYDSPTVNVGAQQINDKCYDTVPKDPCTHDQRRRSTAASESVHSSFDVTKSVYDQTVKKNRTDNKSNNRHSLPSISRGALTFTSSFEKETRTAPLPNGLFIEANSTLSKNDKNNNKINCCDKNVEGGEKTIIQASTSELLQALSIFVSDKFRDVRYFDASHVVTWLRAVDRALIMQGWQDIAFINPANLVFVYMLIREHFRENSLKEIVSVDEIQALILTCLYISYSYMGNEISYPLKPFIAETADRVEFWQRCVSIANAHSANMLRLNASSAFFLNVFTELKTFSNRE